MATCCVKYPNQKQKGVHAEIMAHKQKIRIRVCVRVKIKA